MLQTYEYKVVPAPSKGRKGPGVKAAQDRFAYALEAAMNMLAADGWEYLRSDTLPSEERQGLTSTQTVFRSVLVFRRATSVQTVESTLPEATSAEPASPAPTPAPPAQATPIPPAPPSSEPDTGPASSETKPV